jgi:hypothetical protein
MILPEWAFWLSLATMFVGLLGVFLPVVPGVGLIWLVALVYAIAERFATIDPLTFFFLTILGAVGVTSDLWMSQAGAKAGGASLRSMLFSLLGGALGALIGATFGGVGAVPGVVLGALAGVLFSEWRERGDWHEAFRAAGGWLVGCTLSGAVQFIISGLMILIFVWQVLRG